VCFDMNIGRRTLEAELANLCVERAAVDSEPFGCADDIAGLCFKSLSDEVAFNLFQGQVVQGRRGGHGLVGGPFEFETGIVDNAVVAEQHRAFKHVAQFANVTGP